VHLVDNHLTIVINEYLIARAFLNITNAFFIIEFTFVVCKA